MVSPGKVTGLQQLATGLKSVRIGNGPLFDGGQMQIYTEPSRSDAREISESSGRRLSNPLSVSFSTDKNIEPHSLYSHLMQTHLRQSF